MKVKVSYAVDLSEIPDIIRQLVNKNNEILSEMTELSDALTVGDYGVASHRKLELLAERSATLTESYTDCVSILSGFLQTMVPAISPEEATELQDKVDKLKQVSRENEVNVEN